MHLDLDIFGSCSCKHKLKAVQTFCKAVCVVQEIQPSGSLGKTVTMATYIRDVFLEQVRLLAADA